MVNTNNYLLDSNNKAYFLNFSCNCWLAIRLEFVGACIITFTALLAVLGRSYHLNSVADTNSYAGVAGLAISLALSVTQSLNWSVRMASDLESQMVSVERISTFTAMEQEAAHYIADADPPTVWPRTGRLVLRNVSMKYRKDLPQVLCGVNVEIQAKEKIGIVGRTGAGYVVYCICIYALKCVHVYMYT
jgi:ATP-binding cassette subfamily C (CFTR/MRP) protein 1